MICTLSAVDGLPLWSTMTVATLRSAEVRQQSSRFGRISGFTLLLKR